MGIISFIKDKIFKKNLPEIKEEELPEKPSFSETPILTEPTTSESSDDHELMKTKLDLINSRLDNIDRRLANIEKIAEESK